MKRELGGLADDAFDLVGILYAGNLQDDAVAALLLNGGLRGSERVDAVLDDLERLLNCPPDPIVEAFVGQREGELQILRGNVVELDGRAGREQSLIEWRVEIVQNLSRLLHVGFVGKPHRHAVGGSVDPLVGDTSLSQCPANIARKLLGKLVAEVVAVDLQKHVRAALKIEP